MSKEIEKKFLLPLSSNQVLESGLAELVSREYLYQTYLAYSDDQEIRIRKNVDPSGHARFTHTFKSGHGLTREEIEYTISEQIYEQLLNRTKMTPLEKVRTTVNFGGYVFEIDEYKQVELTVVEVEFPDEASAHAFTPPEWFGRELGQEEEYRNKTLWMKLQISE